ncbi:class III lanthionine synthetase LanKC [Streptomyces sp. NBC_01498]|uniref:class III lanthionine synthetase LanKC n=1 Tax=Streptomyces sp. NBC_01498 TaxID=2975870 RepID=UPI002E7B6C3D|nr:class III lanthionine synthetase LanKC [Streptomyces sp. NBC_01498]WTL28303.1 class III lanthionine synthetase LanKC [Streptomyces sp. NBC_01498]
MNKGYAVFCDADRHFYDSPHRLSPAADTTASATSTGTAARGTADEYEAARRPVPEGWQRHRSGDWLAFRPVEHELPAQGWKIHVSACLDNAESILARTIEYCVARRIAFKFVPSRYLLHTRNAKYADRGASGKFITVYPVDDEQFGRVAGELDALLAGEPGPYILSDLRWNSGPVHVRYGSFTRRDCYADGALRPAIENAEGRLVPDPRGPVFRIPDWITPPEVLRPHLEARAATTVAESPYVVEQALHFSNGGGVYVARDSRTGEKVVLKEARPHAGLAADGADAVTRLRREREALEKLSGLACTPEVRDAFELGGHHFLVLEFVEGKPLNSFFARRHPLIDADPGAERLADYTRWALRVYGLVEKAVAEVHGRGIVFNDLHLFNIMVSEDESSVALLDFEAAAPAADNGRQTVANPAFVAPAGRRGYDVDRYALACLRLALFIPLTSLFAVDRGKAAHLADVVAREFPVDRAFLDEAVAEIMRDPGAPAARSTGPSRPAPYLPAEPADWPASRDSMVRAILASATPDRDDRYFPGDIAQFATTGGGLSFGYGTAGVLYALAESGADPCPAAEEWLLERTKQPESGTPLGFYDGLAGLSWTLHRLGHPHRALELAELTLRQPWDDLPADLHGGAAGLGLALSALGEATGESGLDDAALRCAELAARAVDATPPGTMVDGTHRAGLLYGGAGVALLFIRLYERTHDTALLDLAAKALGGDLDRCVQGAGGTLQVNEGWRTMPYLGAGSVGIGTVLDDYLAHRADERFERARGEIVRAAQATFYAQPGLFRGAAGMVLHLSRTSATGPGTEPADIARQMGTLAWHALPYQGQLAFPGEQMMRLSMDLATGTAGCLLAVAAAQAEKPARLPFLPPLKKRPMNRLRLES